MMEHFSIGLCNSKRIDKLLARQKLNIPKEEYSDCDICKEQTKKLSNQIHQADKDLVVDKMLQMCGHAGSYSDACRAMVLDNFDDIYE